MHLCGGVPTLQHPRSLLAVLQHCSRLEPAVSHYQRGQIPLRTLLSMDAGDAVGQHMANRAVEYYAQLWSLILYIRSQPQWEAGMERLLADAAKGQLGEGLGYKPGPWSQLSTGGRSYNRAISEITFTTYITKDLPAFEKGLRAYQMKLSGLK